MRIGLREDAFDALGDVLAGVVERRDYAYQRWVSGRIEFGCRHSITALLDQRFSAVKGFRVSSFRVGFDPANSQQGAKSVFGEPGFAGLRTKGLDYVANFCFAERFVEPYETIRRA